MDSELVNHLGSICVHLDSIHVRQNFRGAAGEMRRHGRTRTYSVPSCLLGGTLRESGGGGGRR